MRLRILADRRDVPYASLSLSRSLEQLTSALRWRSHAFRPDLVLQRVELHDGNTIRFAGYLEHITGDPFEGYSYAARSLTSALLVTDAIGTEYFSDTSALAISRTLANRAGVPLAAAPTDRVRRFRLERGESYGKALHRLAEANRFVATDTAAGALYGYRTHDSAAATWADRTGALTQPIQVDIDFADWRSTWVCRGQREVMAPEISSGDGDPTQMQQAIDTRGIRPSRRVLPSRSASSRADAKRLAEWHAKKALARAVRVTATHSRWPQGVDTGSRVRIRADAQGIDDDFVVAALALEVSSSAAHVTASCVLPDVYSYRPLRPAVERRVSRWALARGRVERVR